MGEFKGKYDGVTFKANHGRSGTFVARLVSNKEYRFKWSESGDDWDFPDKEESIDKHLSGGWFEIVKPSNPILKDLLSILN